MITPYKIGQTLVDELIWPAEWIFSRISFDQPRIRVRVKMNKLLGYVKTDKPLCTVMDLDITGDPFKHTKYEPNWISWAKHEPYDQWSISGLCLSDTAVYTPTKDIDANAHIIIAMCTASRNDRFLDKRNRMALSHLTKHWSKILSNCIISKIVGEFRVFVQDGPSYTHDYANDDRFLLMHKEDDARLVRVFGENGEVITCTESRKLGSERKDPNFTTQNMLDKYREAIAIFM